MESDSVDLVIINYNTANLIQNSIESIIQLTKYPNYNIIIVDNCSDDESWSVIKKLRYKYPNKIKAIQNSINEGYGKACNLGSKIGNGDYICFMNSDIFVSDDCKDWITPMLQVYKDEPMAAVVAPLLISPDNMVMGAGVFGSNRHRIGRGWNEPYTNQYTEIEECITVSGAVYMVRRDLFEQFNGFDPYYFHYFEETDLDFTVRNNGFKVMFTPFSKLIHLHMGTCKDQPLLSNYARIGEAYFNEKWKDMLQNEGELIG